MFDKVVVIDARGHLLGRLASYVAKQLLSGKFFIIKANMMVEELCVEIEKGTIGPKDDPKTRSKEMAEKYEWDRDLAGTKLWNFGKDILYYFYFLI